MFVFVLCLCCVVFVLCCLCCVVCVCVCVCVCVVGCYRRNVTAKLEISPWAGERDFEVCLFGVDGPCLLYLLWSL